MAMPTKDSGKIVVTIFYPDATSGAHLVAAFQNSLKNLGEADALDLRPWRLDILEWPEMQVQATHDVACSDIVVIPNDDAYARSAFFRRWCETWPTASEAQQLVMVPAPDLGGSWIATSPPQFVHWLQELAGRKGMELAVAGTSDGRIRPASNLTEVGVPSTGPLLSPPHEFQTMDEYPADLQSPPAPRFLGLNE